MGKKHVIKKTEEEILKEGEKIEERVRKGAQTLGPSVKLSKGRAYINATYNNTIITLTDFQGNVLSWASAGSIGFKGTKKSTPFAATKVGEIIAENGKKIGLKEISVFVKGVGSGRESAVRSLGTHGLNIVSIKDITPLPHNGCRPPKVRRV
jgi:small subunit ribosomal protein S11